MPVVNRPPDLGDMFARLERRVRVLEHPTQDIPPTGELATTTWASAADDAVRAWAAGQIAAASAIPASYPRGVLGYAQPAAGGQTTSVPQYVDVTGLSVTVTVAAGRRIKVSTALRVLVSTGSNVTLSLCADGSEINNETLTLAGANYIGVVAVNSIQTPTAGAHTYKVRISVNAGTATILSGQVMSILVEDIGT